MTLTAQSVIIAKFPYFTLESGTICVNSRDFYSGISDKLDDNGKLELLTKLSVVVALASVLTVTEPCSPITDTVVTDFADVC